MSDTSYKLLAVDVDGTLLNSSHEVPTRHREALHRAHQAGLKVALCTGRSLTETRMVIESVGLDMDFVLLVFGAILAEPRTERTLHGIPLDRETGAELTAFLASHGYPVFALCDVTEADTDYLWLGGKRNVELYQRWMDLSPCRAERITSWSEADGRSIYRVGVLGDPEELRTLYEMAERRFPAGTYKANVIHAPNYGLDVIEMFHPSVNKWTGLVKLCDLYGIPSSSVAAVGDDVNDVEMIASAGLGVAMGNAVPEVREVADWVTASHDEDGLAHLVDRLLAGELDEMSRHAEV